jgi:hypothetical protein
LYAVTGNAFEGGLNRGKRFREDAGYGERLVELGPDLRVRGSSHPRDIHRKDDLDFVGSPVVFQHGPCGELAAALNKNGSLYLWRTRNLAAGPVSKLRLSNPTLAAPLLSQAAYSARTGALYVSTPSRLVRVDVDGKCRARVGWARKVGSGLFNGSPTIAGDTVWLVANANAGSALVAFRTTTGQPRYQARLAGPGYVAPTVAGDRIYVPLYMGGVQGFALGAVLGQQQGGSGSGLNEYRSFADGRHGWASRENGVYSTADGGATWQLVYPRSAVRVALVTPSSGMIAVGERISKCGCRQVRLWTANGGTTWTRTPRAVGAGFAAAAGTLWWWRGASLYRAKAWPPGAGGLKGVRVVSGKGAIVDVQPVPGGAAALVTRRVGGFGFDRAPLLRFAQNGSVRNRVLPAVVGDVLVSSFNVDWPSIEVHGSDVTAFTRHEQGSVLWRSADGGATWTVSRS